MRRFCAGKEDDAARVFIQPVNGEDASVLRQQHVFQ